MTQALSIVSADLSREAHQKAVVEMTHAYARDGFGNGAPLSAEVIDRLISGLKAQPTTTILLAFEGDRPVGIATCFVGFSTFHAKPLLNLHDLVVIEERRGTGVGRALLAAVEEKAQSLGCCKVTLEVVENNDKARRTYERAGFEQVIYAEKNGGALFYAKPLPSH